jgi:hypothetical protein
MIALTYRNNQKILYKYSEPSTPSKIVVTAMKKFEERELQ